PSLVPDALVAWPLRCHGRKDQFRTVSLNLRSSPCWPHRRLPEVGPCSAPAVRSEAAGPCLKQSGPRPAFLDAGFGTADPTGVVREGRAGGVNSRGRMRLGGVGHRQGGGGAAKR